MTGPGRREPPPPAGEGSRGSRAGKDYWDAVWRGHETRPALLEPRWNRDFLIRRFDRYASRERFLPSSAGSTLLEVGCAGSLWLPYFAQRWRYRVEGLDYSEQGCRQAEAVLRRYGVEGKIHLADFFEPPASLPGRFDVVLSCGVVEHFEDRAAAMAALGRFLKPTGTLVTIVPNLCGAMGTLTRIFAPDIYRRHVPTSREDLAAAHAASGLHLVTCDYFLPVHFGVLNFESVRPALLRSAVSGACTIVSALACSLADLARIRATSRRMSPYVLAVAVPAAGECGRPAKGL